MITFVETVCMGSGLYREDEADSARYADLYDEANGDVVRLTLGPEAGGGEVLGRFDRVLFKIDFYSFGEPVERKRRGTEETYTSVRKIIKGRVVDYEIRERHGSQRVAQPAPLAENGGQQQQLVAQPAGVQP